MKSCPSKRRLSILFLCDDNRGHANNVLDHINAFTEYSEHEIYLYNPRSIHKSIISLEEFDAVIVHYSLFILSEDYLAKSFREKLRKFKGLKLQFIQDEYRWIDQIAEMMRYIGIDVLFSLVPSPSLEKIWSEKRLPGVEKITTLAGYVPQNLVGFNSPALKDRPIDIGYRGRIVPFWLGAFGQEKVWIGERFLKHSLSYDLKCDIAWREEDRIYGADWVKFIYSCKAILGTESGASIADFEGTLQKRVDNYLLAHPKADFSEVHQNILAPHEENAPIRVISPRVFEGAALRSALVLFPGEYSNIIHPWKHYIPLAKDFSNVDEVVEKIKDLEFLNNMVENTYNDIIASGKYSLKEFIVQFDQVINENVKIPSKRGKFFYHLSKKERILSKIFLFIHRHFIQNLIKTKNKLLPIISNPYFAFQKIKILFRFLKKKCIWRVLLTKDSPKKLFSYLAIKDILRLAIIHDIQFQKKKSYYFHVSAQLDNESQVRLISHFEPEKQSPLNLEGKKIRNFVWDHSRLGKSVVYLKVGNLPMCSFLGETGIYPFHIMSQFCSHLSASEWKEFLIFLGVPLSEG